MMIDERKILAEIDRRIEIRRAIAVYFDGRVCASCAVISELRDLIRFVNQNKEQ